MRLEVEREVVIGRPYLTLFAGFAVAMLLDMVLNQQMGLSQVIQANEMVMLAIGLSGIALGFIVNIGYIRRRDTITPDDVADMSTWGVGTFVVMTIINSLIRGFAQYRAAVAEQTVVIVLAAAPFEEAFFRLFLASLLFRAQVPVFSQLARTLGIGEGGGRWMALVATCMEVAAVFTMFHAAVAPLSDPSVSLFYAINAAAYTFVFLKTGNIMASTTTHLLHNTVVMLL